MNFFEALVLTFDSEATGADPLAWDRDQTIFVRAVDDVAEEGLRTVVISHSIRSDNAAFDKLNIPNVEMTLVDNDKASVLIRQTDLGTQVVEGDAVGDTYTVALTKQPDAGETVTVDLLFDADQVSLSQSSIEFNAGNWDAPVVVTVTAHDDATAENPLRSTIGHTVSSIGGTDPEFAAVADMFEVKVEVRDNDAGGLLVTQSGGNTLVSETQTDTYSLVLTQQPTAPVTVTILSDGQTLVSADSDPLGRLDASGDEPTVTFDETNWDIPFVVRVAVNPDAVIDDGQPVQAFPAQPHALSPIRGPLIIEGSVIEGKDRALRQAVILPTETDAPLPVLNIDTDESQQTDTLNVFNDGSVSDDDGHHGNATQASGLAQVYEVAQGDIDLNEFGNISGLNMGSGLVLNFGTVANPDNRTFDGGISYHGVEMVDILLGQGEDDFTVSDTS